MSLELKTPDGTVARPPDVSGMLPTKNCSDAISTRRHSERIRIVKNLSETPLCWQQPEAARVASGKWAVA